MVRALLRPSLDGTVGTPSAASFSGPEGRTALHAAAACSKGRTPLYFAALSGRPDVVEMFLETHASDEAIRISDNHGLFPVHAAAMVGNTRIVDALIKKCPDYYELVDDGGRNFLRCAVQHNQETVVRHICRNDKFGMLLNATDTQGNTPLHLAAKHGYPRIAILLLQKTSVETGIMNKNGLTALDLACKELKPGLTYFLNPHVVVFDCLNWSRAPHTTGGVNINIMGGNPSEDEAPNEHDDDPSKTGTIASVLIATVAFAAAFTLPGGLVADDHPGAGTAVLARRFAFRAFVVSDAMAFLCSIVATNLLIYAARRVPLSHRYWYNILASRLVPVGEQFTIAAFAFGFNLVLGDANRGLVVFVYAACLATELFCFPGIWISMHLGLAKAIWRQAGWRGLANVHEGSSSLREWFRLFTSSLVYGHLERPVFVVLISATFIVAIALNFALPHY
ncbi:unnamed protein product [Urochloa decumbens]|uniref:PGG domain-containing protein n=1 Tax=Urochloa decumbens TaxID=240449 RepID=A0ABC9GUB7_9POAL